jgi:hypothetical protein
MADITMEKYIALIRAAPDKEAKDVKKWTNLVNREIENLEAISTTVVSKSVMRRFNETAYYLKLELKEALENIPPN